MANRKKPGTVAPFSVGKRYSVFRQRAFSATALVIEWGMCYFIQTMPFLLLRIVVLVKGEYGGRVTIASTASVATLADFAFRETPAPKHKNCLLG